MKNKYFVLGIGCIEDVQECPDCGKQLLIGYWDRTDGKGGYHEVDQKCDCFKEIGGNYETK